MDETSSSLYTPENKAELKNQFDHHLNQDPYSQTPDDRSESTREALALLGNPPVRQYALEKFTHATKFSDPQNLESDTQTFNRIARLFLIDHLHSHSPHLESTKQTLNHFEFIPPHLKRLALAVMVRAVSQETQYSPHFGSSKLSKILEDPERYHLENEEIQHLRHLHTYSEARFSIKKPNHNHVVVQYQQSRQWFFDHLYGPYHPVDEENLPNLTISHPDPTVL